jgi:hypothetical protein
MIENVYNHCEFNNVVFSDNGIEGSSKPKHKCSVYLVPTDNISPKLAKNPENIIPGSIDVLVFDLGKNCFYGTHFINTQYIEKGTTDEQIKRVVIESSHKTEGIGKILKDGAPNHEAKQDSIYPLIGIEPQKVYDILQSSSEIKILKK